MLMALEVDFSQKITRYEVEFQCYGLESETLRFTVATRGDTLKAVYMAAAAKTRQFPDENVGVVRVREIEHELTTDGVHGDDIIDYYEM